MICTECGKDCEEKVSGLFYCSNCDRPAAEFCKCEDEILPMGGVCGKHAICEKCGKAFPELM